jgi:Uma2 family endonuclease
LVRTYSLQEFWDLPEPADSSKLELIKGVLYMTPPPDAAHNEAACNLIDRLTEEIRRCGYRGRLYVPRAALWVDEATHLEPDLFYVSEELAARMDRRRQTSANLVVEILSPSNAVYDRTTKSDTYQAMGIRELWLVDTETRTVEVRSFEADKTAVYGQTEVLRSEVLPKIEIPVSALFA